MQTYKGTDKDMQCRGYQYELGKTEMAAGAVRCGNEGFHSCEAPFDVLRYYPLRNGNRYFASEASGKIDRTGADDSKLASSEITLKAEINLPCLIKAQIGYTRRKAETGERIGDWSNLAGGARSNLAGGVRSNLAGGTESNLAGGTESNLAGGDWSNLAGGDWSNLAGGDWSNLAGGTESNLACGTESNLAGGARSNLAGGARSNLAGGDWSNLAGGTESNLAGGTESNLAGGVRSLLSGRTGCKLKAGLNSILVLSEWAWNHSVYKPIHVRAVIVDGKNIKPDTWYTLEGGEIKEVRP